VRIIAATVAVAAALGWASAAPAEAAAPAAVSSISVAPQMDNQGTISLDVSWTGADPSADGVVVCLKRGTVTPSTPDTCESRVAVAAPRTSSGPITFYPAKTYVVAVYDYVGTTPDPTYSTPVSQVRHGTKLSFSYQCPSYKAGSQCTISALLKDVYKGAAVARRPVELWTAGTQKNAHWSRLVRKTTDSTGHARTTVTLDKTKLFQWRYVTVGAHELSTYTARYSITVAS
jgi:hypothetical protein